MGKKRGVKKWRELLYAEGKVAVSDKLEVNMFCHFDQASYGDAIIRCGSGEERDLLYMA